MNQEVSSKKITVPLENLDLLGLKIAALKRIDQRVV